MLWFVGFVALLPFYSPLAEAGRLWWLWTCTAGLGLGLLGLEYCRRRRNAQGRGGRPDRGSPGRDAGGSVRTRSSSGSRRVVGVLGHRHRLLLAGQLDLGVRTAAVVVGHHPAVVVGVAVGAHPEHLGQRSGEPDQEAARVAVLRGPTWPAARPGRPHRRASAGPPCRGPPPRGCGPGPAYELLRPPRAPDRGRRGPPAPRPPGRWGPAAGPRPRPAAGRRARGRRAAGAPCRAPSRGRRSPRSPGQQHDLVDGDALGVRDAGDGDRPVPPDVAGVGAAEEVAGGVLVLGLDAQVLADLTGRGLLQQRGPGHSHSGSQDGVGARRRCSRRNHVTRSRTLPRHRRQRNGQTAGCAREHLSPGAGPARAAAPGVGRRLADAGAGAARASGRGVRAAARATGRAGRFTAARPGGPPGPRGPATPGSPG